MAHTSNIASFYSPSTWGPPRGAAGRRERLKAVVTANHQRLRGYTFGDDTGEGDGSDPIQTGVPPQLYYPPGGGGTTGGGDGTGTDVDPGTGGTTPASYTPPGSTPDPAKPDAGTTKGLSTAAKVGIGVAAVVVLGGATWGIWAMSKKKRRGRR